MSSQAYSANMSVMGWEVTSGITIVLTAVFLLPLYLKMGLTTLPTFIEKRYDKGTKYFVTWLFMLCCILNLAPTALYTGALALSTIFDIPGTFHISATAGIWIMVWLIGIIGAIYAIFGGLKAVALSDTLNGILLVIARILIPVFAIVALGGGNFGEGFHTFLTAHPEKLNSIGSSSDPLPFSAVFRGLLLVNMYYWGTNQSIIQRGFGARSLKEGQKGFILAAAMFGAILSTFNSLLNSSSTLFALDVYKPMHPAVCSLISRPSTVSSMFRFSPSCSSDLSKRMYLPLPQRSVLHSSLSYTACCSLSGDGPGTFNGLCQPLSDIFFMPGFGAAGNSDGYHHVLYGPDFKRAWRLGEASGDFFHSSYGFRGGYLLCGFLRSGGLLPACAGLRQHSGDSDASADSGNGFRVPVFRIDGKSHGGGTGGKEVHGHGLLPGGLCHRNDGLPRNNGKCFGKRRASCRLWPVGSGCSVLCSGSGHTPACAVRSRAGGWEKRAGKK